MNSERLRMILMIVESVNIGLVPESAINKKALKASLLDMIDEIFKVEEL